MKYNIVKLGDKYAIRRTRGFWIFKDVQYFDLKSINCYWWSRERGSFADCLGTEAQINREWNRLMLGETEEVIR